jgi:glutamate dehydrogenase/leucine dehydrogenase
MDKPVELCSLIIDHKNIVCKDEKDDDEICKIMHDIYIGCCKQNNINNEDADKVVIHK